MPSFSIALVLSILAASPDAGPGARPAFAVAVDTTADRTAFERLYARALPGVEGEAFGATVVRVGEMLRGTPYVAGILDDPAEETLIAPLDRFDCVLYVEAVLALARGLHEGDASYAGYLRRVAEQRYGLDGVLAYENRLHYFSSWVLYGADRGLVTNLTPDLPGALPYPKRIDYMTTHRGQYPRLADDATFRMIESTEVSLIDDARFYVPKARVRAAYGRIEPGDVIAMTTTIAGLDVTHVGFATVSANGTVGFLHASPQGGVKRSPDLAAYLAGNRAQSGVWVLRPNG